MAFGGKLLLCLLALVWSLSLAYAERKAYIHGPKGDVRGVGGVDIDAVHAQLASWKSRPHLGGKGSKGGNCNTMSIYTSNDEFGKKFKETILATY